MATNTHATVVTVSRTSELTTVFSSIALFTKAGAVDAASAVIAVIWTDEFRAVEARPWLVANTLIIYAVPPAQAVVEAVGLGAILTNEALITEAGPVDTVTIVTTVQQTKLSSAVIPTKALKALTFAIHTAALVLAVVGALRFGAVGALPSGLTYTAACVSAPVPTAITVGLCGHFTWGKARREYCEAM